MHTMTRDTQRFDSAAQHLTRRNALAGVGTLVVTGGAVHALSGGARAQVSIDDWHVPDASFEAASVEPVVDADIAFAYDTGGGDVRALAFELLVDDHAVASDELVTDATSLESTVTLSGPITSSAAWDAADFDVSVAESVQQDVTVAVRFAALSPDDSEIVTDRAESTSTVAVSHPQESEYTASVGGEATIRNGVA